MTKYNRTNTTLTTACPQCGEGLVIIWCYKLICIACQNTESAAPRMDESAQEFDARLTDICERWAISPDVLDQAFQADDEFEVKEERDLDDG